MSEHEFPAPSPTDAAAFRALAERVLGRDWVQRLARAVDVNIRTAQRWAAATKVISPRAWAFLREQDAALTQAHFEERVTDAAVAAIEAGATPHTIAAMLKEHAERMHEGVQP